MFFRRYSLPICILALLCMPLMSLGAKAALESMTNDAGDWLPEDFPQTETIRWFGERFSGDAMMVVSWPGCTLNDERLDHMRDGLLEARGSIDGGPSEPLFQLVFTGRDTLSELTAPPVRLPRDQAIARMRGWLVGPEETGNPTTCAVAFLSRTGWVNRKTAVQSAYDVGKSIGLNAEDLRLGGPAVDSVAIDDVSNQWLIPLIAVAILVAVAVAWWSLQRVSLVVPVFFYSIFAWTVCLSIVYVCGVKMDAVLITMPSLVYVLAVSSAVHMTGYYRKAIGEVGILNAPAQALRVGWAPCMAAAVTTAFGVGSLMISEIVPVRRFGIFSAVGVVVAVILLYVLWPSSVQCLLGRRGATRSQDGKEAARTGGKPPRNQHDSLWWLPLFRIATTRWSILLLLLALAVPLLAYGVTKIRMSVSLRDLFSKRSQVIRNYSWLETNIGPLIPVDVILRFPNPDPEDPYALLDRVRLVEHARKRINQIPAVGATLATSTFLPPIPPGDTLRQTVRSSVMALRIERSRQRLLDIKYLYDEYDESGSHLKEELWRISGRVMALGDLEYASFLHELQQVVNDTLERDVTARQLGVTAEVTGGVFLVAMAQDQLLIDLKNSFLMAFLLIAVAMIVLTRSISAGLISMIPNVFPALLIFGAMGWLDLPVDIGVMMTASVALGIAVDDTSHFLAWFRRGLAQGLPRIEAIRYAYECCATSMMETSVICGLGILPFVLSPFMPVARFALLMALLLFIAMEANLLLLAAALASPLGRFQKSALPGETTPETRAASAGTSPRPPGKSAGQFGFGSLPASRPHGSPDSR